MNTPPSQPCDIAQAIELVAQGGTIAERGAEQLFKLLWRKFVNDYVRAGQPLAQAQDLASEAFQKILHGLGALREPAAFIKWANTIARNTLYTHIRDSSSQREHEVPMDGETLDAMFEGTSDYSQMDPVTRLCLKTQLQKFCKFHEERAFWLERWIGEDESLQEISAAIGRTQAATKEYISQCRKYLQQYLRECLI